MIERINPSGLSQPPGYSHVVVASGSQLLTTAGAVPLNAEGNLVGRGNHLAQARQTIDNLLLALEAAGATARDVVKTTVYLVADDVPLGRAWEVFRCSPISEAPSTLLGVASLGYTGQLVEIEAVAVVP